MSVKKSLTKGRAFWAGYFGILLVHCLAAWISPESLPGISPATYTALVALVTAFSAANVGDNLQKSKYYHPEMKEQ
jgi:hypothetical protein